jgi:hypothetical protein
MPRVWIVPKPVTKGNEFTVPDFIEKIIKYSELISDNKKTSANNSISSLLSKVFRKSLQRSKPKDSNHRPGHASNMDYATLPNPMYVYYFLLIPALLYFTEE